MQSLFFLSFKNCPSTINSPIHTRCRVPTSETVWKGAKQTTIYLHTSSNSKLEISEGGEKHILEPGNIVTIVNNDVTMKCQGDDCDSSIWHTVTIPQHQYHVNDANGVVFKVTDKVFPDDYTCFFDFGENTRVFTKTMNFSRVGTVLDVTYFDEKSNKVVTSSFTKLEEMNMKIKTPTFIHINRAKYSNVSFRIIAGSSRRMENEFDGAATSGAIKVFNQEIEEPIDEELLKSIPIISDIGHAWIDMQYLFLTLSIAIMIATIVSIVYLTKQYKHQEKEEELSDSEDNIVNGGEMELGNI